MLPEKSASMEKMTQSFRLLKSKIIKVDELTAQHKERNKRNIELKQLLTAAEEKIKQRDAELQTLRKESTKFNQQRMECESLQQECENYRTAIEHHASEMTKQNKKNTAVSRRLHEATVKMQEMEAELSGKKIQDELNEFEFKSRIQELERENIALRVGKTTNDVASQISQEEFNVEPIKVQKMERRSQRKNSMRMTSDLPQESVKSVVNDENTDQKDHPFAVFCDKCSVILHNPTDRIMETMTRLPPLLPPMPSTPRHVRPRDTHPERQRRRSLSDRIPPPAEKIPLVIDDIQHRLQALENAKITAPPIPPMPPMPPIPQYNHPVPMNYYGFNTPDQSFSQANMMTTVFSKMMKLLKKRLPSRLKAKKPKNKLKQKRLKVKGHCRHNWSVEEASSIDEHHHSVSHHDSPTFSNNSDHSDPVPTTSKSLAHVNNCDFEDDHSTERIPDESPPRDPSPTLMQSPKTRKRGRQKKDKIILTKLKKLTADASSVNYALGIEDTLQSEMTPETEHKRIAHQPHNLESPAGTSASEGNGVGSKLRRVTRSMRKSECLSPTKEAELIPKEPAKFKKSESLRKAQLRTGAPEPEKPPLRTRQNSLRPLSEERADDPKPSATSPVKEAQPVKMSSLRKRPHWLQVLNNEPLNTDTSEATPLKKYLKDSSRELSQEPVEINSQPTVSPWKMSNTAMRLVSQRTQIKLKLKKPPPVQENSLQAPPVKQPNKEPIGFILNPSETPKSVEEPVIHTESPSCPPTDDSTRISDIFSELNTPLEIAEDPPTLVAEEPTEVTHDCPSPQELVNFIPPPKLDDVKPESTEMLSPEKLINLMPLPPEIPSEASSQSQVTQEPTVTPKLDSPPSPPETMDSLPPPSEKLDDVMPEPKETSPLLIMEDSSILSPENSPAPGPTDSQAAEPTKFAAPHNVCLPPTKAENKLGKFNPQIKIILDDVCAPMAKKPTINPDESIDSYLKRHLVLNPKLTQKFPRYHKEAATKVAIRSEQSIAAELKRLTDSEGWDVTVHQSVVDNLSKVPSSRAIAKCIVKFVADLGADMEPVVNTFTPPAPLLTKSQQRVIALVKSLDKQKPLLINDLFGAINHFLFYPANPSNFEAAEALARLFVALARMKKDRERVRILVCDALYSLPSKAYIIIWVVLTNWSEVLNSYDDTRKQYLQICIVHMIRCHNPVVWEKAKVIQIKRLLGALYQYPDDLPSSKSQVDKLLLELIAKDGDKSATLAILLLAKKEGTDWTKTNIIYGGLMNLIVENKDNPCIYDALRLLGSLLRVFPLEDKDGTVKTIVEQLCGLLDDGTALVDVQEGVASALLCLSRHMFDRVAKSILAWKPSRSLPKILQAQIQNFFDARSVVQWNRIQINHQSYHKIEAKDE